MEDNDQKGESYSSHPEEGAEGRSAKAGEAQLKYLDEARRIVLSFDEIKEYAVFVFGSRADGTAHKRSDIDIGILGRQALPAFIKLDIEEQLEESNIPLRVDFVDFCKVDQAFKKEALKTVIVWNLPKDIKLG